MHEIVRDVNGGRDARKREEGRCKRRRHERKRKARTKKKFLNATIHSIFYKKHYYLVLIKPIIRRFEQLFE